MRRAVIWSVLLVVACKGKQQAATQVPPPARPAWVEAHPTTDAYYVGIGVASKASADYQESAKKNALNDLASEISVQVEGNSLLYTLDKRDQFRETYTNSIRTRTNEQLEGYELVDTYDGGSDHWVYYRLSKAEHARLKALKRQQATDQAIDLHHRSDAALQKGDLRGAVDLELRALLAVRSYWGEAIPVDLDGMHVDLGNELYTSLQGLVAGIRSTALPERCVLDQGNGFRREMLVHVVHQDGGRTTDLVQVPLLFTFPGADGPVRLDRTTDADGRARCTVEHVAIDAMTPELVVAINMKDLVSADLDAALVRGLTAGIQAPEIHIPIDRVLPRLYLRASERNFEGDVGSAGCAAVLKQELTTRGFRFVDGPSAADLIIDLQGKTREGGEASGFFTAFLDLTVTCTDRSSGDVVYQGGRQGLKGVQLNYEKAGKEAYRKGAQELQRGIVPALVGALL
ncbi:MAG: LPP20 family lipoprotein [Flavobacteriales bacterium]|nr:LPP20 family lipoprotein [Flavobacteriales bacterium]MCB9168581.1 LPP20 family lipoprotein [Flavobacteriales bacterium]